MPVNFLLFTFTDFYWISGCILAGLCYAWVVYPLNKKADRFRIGLFALRTLAVALIAWLLFAPPVKKTGKLVEKPLIVIAQDNSASIAVSEPQNFNKQQYRKDLTDLENKLGNEFEVKSYNFSKQVTDSLKFDFSGKQSNAAAIFKLVNERYGNRNIGAIILASDGLYNSGSDPQYESKSIKAPVYTIALGDTIPKKDLLISNVAYNNNVFLDNQFVIEVSVEAWQSKGGSTTLSVKGPGGNLFSKQIQINSTQFRQTIPVTLLAKAKGIQKYIISLAPTAGELSVRNNSQTIFIDVIDGKQNVVIVAAAPHPDISAIRQSIEKNKNYSAGIMYTYKPDNALLDKASLLVLYQIPSANGNSGSILQRIASKPAFFVLGNSTNIGIFSSSQNFLQISSAGNFEETFPGINSSFFAFTLSDSTKNKIRNFAPLISPFGNYGFKGTSQVLLNQKIGNVETDNPLLAFGQNGNQKIGVLTGEGIWKWKMEDFQENGSHNAVDELIGKTIQYLSSKDEQKKFRAYPSQQTFDEGEQVIFNAELYNDAYEAVNTPDVSLSVENNSGKKFSFLFSRNGNSYQLNAGELPAGEYSFTASTALGNKKYSDKGKFIIIRQDIEYRQTTANHQLLNTLASQSGGKMVFPNEIGRLFDLIKKNENVKTISYEDNRYNDLVDFKWIFFLVLALLSLEWFTRKRNGEV